MEFVCDQSNKESISMNRRQEKEVKRETKVMMMMMIVIVMMNDELDPGFESLMIL